MTPTAAGLARLVGPTDADLLARFAAARDDAAFAELVRRHGPAVLAVCRRLTGHAHDAEDAFQAAFLVLARRAGQVRRPDQLSNWLYGVAVRTALDARKSRRYIREEPLAADPAATASDGPDPDLAAVVDEELARLPEKVRAAVVLCELEGVSRRDAAARLGVPEGTLSSRLAHARKVLAARLARRGVAAPATLVTLAGPAAQVPARLIDHTARVAARAAGGAVPPGLVSDRVSSLTDGVLKAMLVSKLRLAAGAVALPAVAAIGAAAVVAQQPIREGRTPQPAEKIAQPAPLIAPVGQGRPAEKVVAKGIEDDDVPYPTTPVPAVVRYEDGKLVVRQRTRAVVVYAQAQGQAAQPSPVVGRKLDAADVLVFDMKGNRLAAKAWREKLQNDQHVLVAWGGVLPNPRELTLFKDDTLIVVFPAGPTVAEVGAPGMRTEYRVVVQPDGSYTYVPFTAPIPGAPNFTPVAPAPADPARIPPPPRSQPGRAPLPDEVVPPARLESM